jgi:hypothetical protein
LKTLHTGVSNKVTLIFASHVNCCLFPVISDSVDGQKFYQGRVTTSTGSSALIFISWALISALRDTTEVHADGTFKTVPAMFYQLFTLHITAYGKVVKAYIVDSKSFEAWLTRSKCIYK